MGRLWLIGLLGLSTVATAQDTPAPPADVTAPADDAPVEPPVEPTTPQAAGPDDLLERARELYLLGDHAAARDALVALTSAPDTPDPVWQQSMVYLGELLYVGGDRAAAEATFRLVLQRNPALRISPYEHPMDVIGIFEFVRDSVLAEQGRAPVQRTPMPWWGYAPFGAPQFKQHKPVRGATYLTLQVGFAAASVGAWAWIDRVRPDPGADGDDAVAATDRARLIRDGFQIPAASLFYLTWGISALDAGLAWRKQHVGPAIGWTPGPGTGSVTLHVPLGGQRP